MPPRPEVVSPGEGLESGLDDIAWAEVRVARVVRLVVSVVLLALTGRNP